MKTFDKARVMRRAWKLFRTTDNFSWSQCLTKSWKIEKEKPEPVSVAEFAAIKTRLRPFRLTGTMEHRMMLNSKAGRKIMRRPDDDESKEMLTEGLMFQSDIINTRRRQLLKFNTLSNKKKFRNRIVNPEFCIRIDVQEYILANP